MITTFRIIHILSSLLLLLLLLCDLLIPTTCYSTGSSNNYNQRIRVKSTSSSSSASTRRSAGARIPRDPHHPHIQKVQTRISQRPSSTTETDTDTNNSNSNSNSNSNIGTSIDSATPNEVSQSTPTKSQSQAEAQLESQSSQPQQQSQQPRPSKHQSWLDQCTRDILDKCRIPLGRLTNDDIESISGLMANWARRKTTHSALQVESLLKRVVDDHNAGNLDAKVTTRMYTMAIDAWAKKGGKQAAHRAGEIHRGMVDAYRLTGDVDIKPSTISYNAVINAWSKSGCDTEAAVNAEGILDEMLEEWRREKSQAHVSLVNKDENSTLTSTDIGTDDNVDATAAHANTADVAVDVDFDADADAETSSCKGDDHNENMTDGEDSDSDEASTTGDGDTSIVKPDVVSFTSVIDTYAKSGNKNGASKALHLLQQMEQLYVEEGQRGMKPNVYTYSACLNAFAKSSDLDAPNQAETLLADMIKAYEAGDMDVKPNVVNYNSVINAWGRCKKEGSSERASQILRTMENEGVEPDAVSYSLVVSAWAHSSNRNATTLAEEALEEMEVWAKEKNREIDDAFDNGLSDHASARGQFDKDGDTPSSLPAIRVHLDVECYNTVLITLSKRREPDASDRAFAILNRMHHLANNGFETVRPNAKSWNSVLNTLSRAQDPHSAERAENILRDMRVAGTQPDVFSYAALLHAYQKNASSYGAERADNIIREMEQLHFDGILSDSPDVYHYTIACACWARSGEPIAAQRCWEILQHMERRVKQGYPNCRPNVRTYNAVIDAYARGHHVDEAEKLLNQMINRYEAGDAKVKPDGFTFNAVINAWTRSRRKDCGSRAEAILKRLLEFHEMNPDVKPDSRSFSHIIDYYARSRECDAGKKAEWLLMGMIKMYERGYVDVLPNIFPFTAVISTYAKAQDKDAGINSERVLHRLEHFNKKFKIKQLAPNAFVMNTVLHAWSKSGHPMPGKRVEEILTYMEEEYTQGNKILEPNTRSYGLALASWAKSLSPDKAEKARDVLERMKKACVGNGVVTMNVHCYNTVLNAAAFTDGGVDTRTKAFNIATIIMEELLQSESIQPISSSFGTYLKACGKLSLPRDLVEPEIAKAFNNCRELGLVNDFVLTQVRYSTCIQQYHALLGDFANTKKFNEKITMKDIPSDWKRNVAAPFFDNAGRSEWWRN